MSQPIDNLNHCFTVCETAGTQCKGVMYNLKFQGGNTKVD